MATIITLRTTIYNYRTLMIELIEIANHQGSVSERWYASSNYNRTLIEIDEVLEDICYLSYKEQDQ